jgi:hypothetical protein
LSDGLFQVNLVGAGGAISYFTADIGAFTVESAPIAPVPEPSGLLLAALGWGLVRWRRDERGWVRLKT